MKRKNEDNEIQNTKKKILLFNTVFPEDIIINIILYMDKEDIKIMINICPDFYKIFRLLRKKSLDELKLGYLNEKIKENIRLLDYYKLPNEYKPWEPKTTIEKFQNNFNEFIYNDKIIQNILNFFFEYNKKNKANFIIAGGSIFQTLFVENQRSTESDIDIFYITNGEEDDTIFYNALKLCDTILLSLKEQNINYCITNYNNVIQVHFKEKEKRSIQIIERKYKTIEELFTVFDLDCCKFAYDGTTIYTMMEGLRSINIKYNYLPIFLNDNKMYLKRLYKYAIYGIQTIFIKEHPFTHLYNINYHITFEKEPCCSNTQKNCYNESLKEIESNDLYRPFMRSIYTKTGIETYKIIETLTKYGIIDLLKYINDNVATRDFFEDINYNLKQILDCKTGYFFNNIFTEYKLKKHSHYTIFLNNQGIDKCTFCNKWFIRNRSLNGPVCFECFK
jgi:hypothetical protein